MQEKLVFKDPDPTYHFISDLHPTKVKIQADPDPQYSLLGQVISDPDPFWALIQIQILFRSGLYFGNLFFKLPQLKAEFLF